MSANSSAVLRKIKRGSSPLIRFDGSFRMLARAVMARLVTGGSIDYDLYFVRFSTNSDCLVKVGFSQDLYVRFARLRHDCPPFSGYRSRVLGYVKLSGQKVCEIAENLFLTALHEFHAGQEWLRLPALIQREISETCHEIASTDQEGFHNPESEREYVDRILKLNRANK